MKTTHTYSNTKYFNVKIFSKKDGIPLSYSGKCVREKYPNHITYTKKIEFDFPWVVEFLKWIWSSIKTNETNIVRAILAECNDFFVDFYKSENGENLLDGIEFYAEVIDWSRIDRYTSENVTRTTLYNETISSVNNIDVKTPFYIEFLINAYNYLKLNGFGMVIFGISLISSIISLITSTINLYSIGELHGVFMFSAIFLTFIVWETLLYHVFCSIIFSFAKTILDRFNR